MKVFIAKNYVLIIVSLFSFMHKSENPFKFDFLSKGLLSPTLLLSWEPKKLDRAVLYKVIEKMACTAHSYLYACCAILLQVVSIQHTLPFCIDIAQYALTQIFKIFWSCHFFSENTFGPLEKLLVGLQGSGRSRWKGLSKTNIFMWY